MADWTPNNAVEAVADAWASIDGRLESFRAGCNKPMGSADGSRYSGYMEEAGELMQRLRARGYVVLEKD